MKKIVFSIFLIIGFILFSYSLLDKSTYFNNFIFDLINPYNPLKANESKRTQNYSSEKWKDPRNIFPIFGYNLPSDSKNLMNSLKIIKKCGINIIINGNLGYYHDALEIKQAFNELKDSNLKWIVTLENECKNDFIFNNTNENTNKNILKYLDLFNDDFVYGWYIWDEPGKNRKFCSILNLVPNNDFSDINNMVKQIRSNQKYSIKLDFINLFPIYWSVIKKPEQYENYLTSFYNSQEFKPRLLCVDYYPLLLNEKGGFRRDYFYNLEILRKKSLEWGIPFWVIVLSSGHDDYKNPSFEEIRFQVYTALAYGAKGIGYYLLSKSFEEIGYRSWIIENYVDNDMVPDSLYGKLFVNIKELNHTLSKLGKYLLDAKTIGIIHTSTYPNHQLYFSKEIWDEKIARVTIKKIVALEGEDPDLILSFFRADSFNNNGFYLLVINKNLDKRTIVNISLNKKYNIQEFENSSGNLKFHSADDSLILNLLPGDGKLFYLFNFN